MFVAMNRFRVIKGKESQFEDIWRNRESRLDQMAGFVQFHLLKGAEAESHTLYASHTVWKDEDAFVAWTKSEHFRASHKGAKARDALYEGPPQFEGFSAVEGA